MWLNLTFYLSPEEPDSGPLAYVANTVLTGPSLQQQKHPKASCLPFQQGLMLCLNLELLEAQGLRKTLNVNKARVFNCEGFIINRIS